MRKLKKPRINPSWEDGLKLLDHANSLRDHILLRLLLFQALREGEILGSYDERHGSLEPLRIRDLDLNRNMITIRGKGDKVAQVFLDKETSDSIKDYLSKKKKKKPDSPLFNLTTRQLQNIVKRYAIEAGLEDAERFSPHVLRAISITRMIHQKDLARAKHHARHSSVRTTIIYDRPSTEERRKDFKDVFEK